uniref:KTSC domain-containing protein n=1 Tax=Parastrongyloides trichosuri TaxID=131310 RepID=A0A0N4ZBQ2_PARTI
MTENGTSKGKRLNVPSKLEHDSVGKENKVSGYVPFDMSLIVLIKVHRGMNTINLIAEPIYYSPPINPPIADKNSYFNNIIFCLLCIILTQGFNSLHTAYTKYNFENETLHWFSKLDCNNAYFQISVHESSQIYLAVRTPYGVYCFRRRVQGYINSAAEYQRLGEEL